MLKKFVFLIVVAFTLQLSWALASVYCLHEADNTTQHFGHHSHEHDATDDEAYSGKSLEKKATYHPDCASCTYSPLGAFSSNLLFPKSLSISDQYNEASLQIPSPFLAQPERPKWMAFA